MLASGNGRQHRLEVNPDETGEYFVLKWSTGGGRDIAVRAKYCEQSYLLDQAKIPRHKLHGVHSGTCPGEKGQDDQ